MFLSAKIGEAIRPTETQGQNAMTPYRLPRPLRTSIQITLAAVAAVCLAPALGARAAPVDYVFTDASTTLLGYTGSISGSFTFDAATNTESAVVITLGGLGPYAGTYEQTAARITSVSDVLLATASIGGLAYDLEVMFLNPLSSSPDPLALVEYCTTSLILTCDPGLGTSDSAPLGSAVFASPVAATPLPAAFPLFGFGLAGLGLLGWRRKRKNAAGVAI
jgi:LPXTG-motif cell wall-anchored protein